MWYEAELILMKKNNSDSTALITSFRCICFICLLWLYGIPAVYQCQRQCGSLILNVAKRDKVGMGSYGAVALS